MTQFCCYRVWDGSHEKHRRMMLLLSLIDLCLISCVIAYVGISLYSVATLDPPPQGGDDPVNFDINSIKDNNGNQNPEENGLIHNSSEHQEEPNQNINITDSRNETDCGNEVNGGDEKCRGEVSKAESPSSKFFPNTPYFEVVGSRIAKSIQLIIYTCQLFMTVFLVRALIRTDTQLMRTWLIVTEIITTIILFVLILHLFGDFHKETVLITGALLIYQFIMIRTMARYIRRTEIELTQFGSIVDFT